MEPRFLIAAPHSAEWPRNGEGSIAVFPDGRWLLAWSGHYGGYRDHSPAHIMAKWSADKGETWSQPFILKQNDGGCNVMSATVAVLSDGSVAHLFHRKESEPGECRPFFRRSTDGGRSFGPETAVVPMKPWYGAAITGSLLELSSGRLFAPLWGGPTAEGDAPRPHQVLAAFSDDMGESWSLSSNSISVEGTSRGGGPQLAGLSEPYSFERRDGTVKFMIRTGLGTVYAAESADGGESVGDAYDTGLESPAAPCAVGRIPATGDILLVWNRARPISPGAGGPRTPLATAISKDEGRTWGNVRELEPDMRFTYMYPSLAFDGETVMVLYSLGEADSVKRWGTNWHHTSLKLALVPYQWFYG